jgi:transcriptional regulator with XRE-family HTH domain
LKPVNRLRALRVNRSEPLTLERLASLVGVTKGHLSNVESGRHGASAELIAKLARVYDRSPAYIRKLCEEVSRAA